MASATILSGVDFNADKDYVYTKAKVNTNGRKSIGILNGRDKKSLYLSTPLMLTWGVNEYTNENGGSNSYDLALQFPNDEYNSPECVAFLKNMQALEQKLKDDAVVNSKDWLNKSKLVPEAVDALWSPMLKYPKDKETGEPDYSRAPTLKVKIPFWEGVFKNVELYDEDEHTLYPSDDNNVSIVDLITKGSNIATIIQCGGIWVANGKFGVTWRLFQAVVKPKATLTGKCHITLSQKDREKITSQVDDDEDEKDDTIMEKDTTTHVEDSDDEEEVKKEVKQEVKEEIEAKVVQAEDQPKKKRVLKKKVAEQ
tara:strand:+ start:4081 stop:5013 length:933 start_codon:yes stop_codon:yes gene_type:complete